MFETARFPQEFPYMSIRYYCCVPAFSVKKQRTLFNYWGVKARVKVKRALVTVPQAMVESCKHVGFELAPKELTRYAQSV